jgi:hypothetical protein
VHWGFAKDQEGESRKQVSCEGDARVRICVRLKVEKMLQRKAPEEEHRRRPSRATKERRGGRRVIRQTGKSSRIQLLPQSCERLRFGLNVDVDL